MSEPNQLLKQISVAELYTTNMSVSEDALISCAVLSVSPHYLTYFKIQAFRVKSVGPKDVIIRNITVKPCSNCQSSRATGHSDILIQPICLSMIGMTPVIVLLN